MGSGYRLNEVQAFTLLLERILLMEDEIKLIKKTTYLFICSYITDLYCGHVTNWIILLRLGECDSLRPECHSQSKYEWSGQGPAHRHNTYTSP